ncbi:DUF1722 domain-containing protein [Macrococcus hajekii]|uniref:DUF1722 domain-containing protein n=1 Tax=Macrococcus hajekii TaxID=198482 RepID=A0A4R6BJY7_9STAP|nr:DUF1722 domain-containing protein [Macrococcus hajekii]TDM01950.1 DUF1722 domain-containing protein [Macrococcus hajekii]GGB08780.1 hypothetical protein GCM10007190_16020 [Macrococcus hajekii]
MDNSKEQKKAVEKRWREEKYKVMYYSQQHYNSIRQLMKNQLADIDRLNREIAEAYSIEPTHGSMVNTFQHIWGYFKKKATEEEKKHILNLIDALPSSNDALITELSQLAIQYEIQYLKDSSLLKAPLH